VEEQVDTCFLVFKKQLKAATDFNSDELKAKRILYSKFYFNMLGSGRRWISLEESAFPSLNYPKRVWIPRGKR
jgi:hypothetical protein